MSSANISYLCPILNGRSHLLANGALNINGNVWTYLAGTNTASNTAMANSIGSSNNPNPMTIGSSGRIPNQIWLSAGQNTKIVITDASNNILDVEDGILGVNDPTFITGYTVANAAYAEANASYNASVGAIATANVAYPLVNSAYGLANSSGNTVAVLANGELVIANALINFINTATMNVLVTLGVANTPQANVEFFVNLSSIGVASGSGGSNGYCNLFSSLVLQWGSYQTTSSTGTINATITFPQKFQNTAASCLVNITSDGGSSIVVRPNGLSSSGFAVTWDAWLDGGSFVLPPSTIYWVAIGY